MTIFYPNGLALLIQIEKPKGEQVVVLIDPAPCSSEQPHSSRWAMDAWGLRQRPCCQELSPLEQHLENERKQASLVYRTCDATSQCCLEEGRAG